VTDAAGPGGGLRALALNTPTHRERAVDAIRAFAILVVVLGHWLAIVLRSDSGRLAGENILTVWPPAQPLTWAVQVMPALFLVGGYANAASWASPSRSGSGLGWIRARVSRLLLPTTAVVISGACFAVVAPAAGLDVATVRTAAWAIALPLWFLALYLVLVAATPILAAVERRCGWRLAAGAAAAAAVVSVLHVHGAIPLVGSANYLLAWLAVYALGMSWRHGRWPAGPRVPALLLIVGAGVAAALVAFGPYPVGLLFAPGAAVQNSAPPSSVMVAYAAAQCGVALLAQPWLEKVCRRRGSIWMLVVAVNAWAMTLYVWHMAAAAVAGSIALAAGALAWAEPLSGSWFALRPLWLLACAAALAVIVAVVGGLERVRLKPAEAGPAATAPRVLAVVAGLVLVSVSLVFLTTGGLGGGGLAGIPPAVGFYLVGVAMLASALAT
jgi:hypothetical protein